MSTRGAIGFKVKGKMVQMYNHCDSYPEGLGAEMVHALINEVIIPGRMQEFKEKLLRLKAVKQDAHPAAKWAKFYANQGASDGSTSDGLDWYATMRNFQGAVCISAILNDRMKHYMPYNCRSKDSWGCEYGYILDFDKGELKMYEDPYKRASKPVVYGFPSVRASSVALKFQLEKFLAEITKSEPDNPPGT